MDSNPQSPGICQRLVRFVLRKLMRPSRLPGTIQVPVEEGSSRKPNSRPNGFVDSEIVVDFRHIDGSEGRSQTSEHWGLTHAPEKDGLSVSNDQTILHNGLDKEERSKDHFGFRIDPKTGMEGQGQGLQELEAVSGRYARGKDLKKAVTMKDCEGKKEANQSADEAITVSNQPHDEEKPIPSGQHWPLRSVLSNINEKSDEYIRSRKKPWRNYSLDA